jgi:hypothetical protein
MQRAQINFPEEGGIVQVESFGVHMNMDGSVFNGLKIESIMDRSPQQSVESERGVVGLKDTSVHQIARASWMKAMHSLSSREDSRTLSDVRVQPP